MTLCKLRFYPLQREQSLAVSNNYTLYMHINCILNTLHLKKGPPTCSLHEEHALCYCTSKIRTFTMYKGK